MRVNEMVKKEDFLRLFVTQLRYQDPLNPLDGASFTAQLAEFSSLEQLVNMNNRIDNLLSYQDSLNNALATNLIGRYVTYRDDLLSYNGQPVDIRFDLQGPTADTVLKIYSRDGQLVREVQLGPLSGTQTYTWDGLDSAGNQVSEGHYRVEVVGTDADGQPVEVIQRDTGRVIGVEFSPEGITYLTLDNGDRIGLANIESITEGGDRS